MRLMGNWRQVLTVADGLVIVLVLKVDDGNAIKRLALHMAGRAARLGCGRSGGDRVGRSSSVLGLPDITARMRLGIAIRRSSENKTGRGQNSSRLEQHDDGAGGVSIEAFALNRVTRNS
jgi:hypothetical protein